MPNKFCYVHKAIQTQQPYDKSRLNLLICLYLDSCDPENKLFSATIQIDCQKVLLLSVNGSCYKNNEKLSS